MTNYAVDMTECTQSSFEKSAIRNVDRVNRLADWVRDDFQRRPQRATLISVRPRLLKRSHTYRMARSGGQPASTRVNASGPWEAPLGDALCLAMHDKLDKLLPSMATQTPLHVPPDVAIVPMWRHDWDKLTAASSQAAPPLAAAPPAQCSVREGSPAPSTAGTGEPGLHAAVAQHLGDAPGRAPADMRVSLQATPTCPSRTLARRDQPSPSDVELHDTQE